MTKWQKSSRQKFDGTSQWSIEAWKAFLAEGGPTFHVFSDQSRNVQELLSLILHCKTMYCCWMTSPSTSITICTPGGPKFPVFPSNPGTFRRLGGLIPGKSLKRERQSVFFTAANPMYDNQDQEEVQYDLDKTRIAVHKNTWRIHPNTVFWCNLKGRSKRRIAVPSNSIARNRSFQHTTCDLY